MFDELSYFYHLVETSDSNPYPLDELSDLHCLMETSDNKVFIRSNENDLHLSNGKQTEIESLVDD